MLSWLVQPLNVGLFPLLLKTLIFHHCSGCLAQDKWCVHQSDLHVVLTSFSLYQLNMSYFLLNKYLLWQSRFSVHFLVSAFL